MNRQQLHIKRWYYGLFILLLLGCAARMPQEEGTFKPTDLVELTKVDPTLKLDIRYATANNLAHRPVYKQARAFLQRDAAMAVAQINQELKPLGYGLMIFDGYRPWSVTKLFWDITPNANKQFVADPKKGSRHNRGCAVDLTLYNLKTVKEVQMTGAYDEMTERSYPNYTGGTVQQRQMRNLLRTKMEAHGFTVFDVEWWHFDYKGWQQYRIENIPFEAIK